MKEGFYNSSICSSFTMSILTKLFLSKILGGPSNSAALRKNHDQRENHSQSDAEGTGDTFVGFIHFLVKCAW